MILSSDAIILRSMRYGDTSKIVTAFTRGHGRVSFIAKGARSRQNRFGSSLEPLTHAQLVFYHKQGRDLQLLSQADTITSFRHIGDDHHRLASGFTMIELVHATTHDEERHEEVLDLLLAALAWMNSPDTADDEVLLHFILRFTALLGFGADLRTCSACGAALDPRDPTLTSFSLDPRTGGHVCRDCAGPLPGVPAAILAHLQRLDDADPATVVPRPDLFHPALDLLLQHLRLHIPEMRRLKSLALLGDFS